MGEKHSGSHSGDGGHSKMIGRGATRPMTTVMDDGGRAGGDGGESSGDAVGQGRMDMDDPQMRLEMLAEHHRKTLWVYWLLVLLGAWMVLAPLTFAYDKAMVSPAGGREVWLAAATRAGVLFWSDIAAGVLLIVFGWRSLQPNRPISLWICCGVGVWLNFAPLLLWAPKPLIYLNDTLVGMAVIALTILIPGMPNMVRYMKMGPTRPPGWTFNPSSWAQRSIMIGLGFAGMVVSRYLAAFQLGYIDSVWDPFFGAASEKVLTSKISESLPISDAGLGAFSYTFEFLMGWMGSPARWRTMPWMVTFFGILVIPLGLVHIFLVASQPIVVGQWCSFCLLAALIMLPMIPLEVDEVVAMGQYLRAARQRGRGLWTAFWKGGTLDGGGPDDRTPDIFELPRHPFRLLRASLWGMTAPWTLIATTLLGLWMMFAPTALGTGRTLADFEHAAGALLITISVVAMGEPVRIIRLLNIAVAAMLAVATIVLGGWAGPIVNDLAVAALAAGLSLPRGKVNEQFGAWQKWIR